MVKVIEAGNVNEAYILAMAHLREDGAHEDSRNGPVIVAPGPVVTVYARPCERVLFSVIRNGNPFFHFMESLWMLAGRNDLAFIQPFVARMAEFSDDGETLHGAYGKRWRSWFGFDQLSALVGELQARPESRRAVLEMWSAEDDLVRPGGKDLPCNTHAYFDLRGGKLNMTVLNRSNDAIWGCYGANVVHFSVMMEYMAAMLGVGVGEYRQFSNNLHVRLVVPRVEEMLACRDVENPYASGGVAPFSLVHEASRWDVDLAAFMEAPENAFETPNLLFPQVARPMYLAWKSHKAGSHAAALSHAWEIAATDWRKACVDWLAGRMS